MCHGLFGYDKLGPDSIPLLQMEYWSGISELRNAGCKVYIARVPPVSSIQDRSVKLLQYLNEHVPGRDINLIAHSMGC